jgi:hypothetical protein
MPYKCATKRKELNKEYFKQYRFIRKDRLPPLYRYPARPTKKQWINIALYQGYVPISGYKGEYLISVSKSGISVRKSTIANKTGYYRVPLSKTRGKVKDLKYFYIHRLVAMAFIPNPESKPCVNHIDHNRANNSLDNLEWVTHKENIAHCIKSGRANFFGRNR